LDQLEAPAAQPLDVLRDFLARPLDGWIEIRTIARQPPALRCRCRCEQRPHPDPRPRAGGADRRGDVRHRSKLRVAAVPLAGERPLAELQRAAAGAHVGEEADAARIALPAAECGGTGPDPERVRLLTIERGEVPGHRAIGDAAAPLEITIAAFPRVAEQQPEA